MSASHSPSTFPLRRIRIKIRLMDQIKDTVTPDEHIATSSRTIGVLLGVLQNPRPAADLVISPMVAGFIQAQSEHHKLDPVANPQHSIILEPLRLLANLRNTIDEQMAELVGIARANRPTPSWTDIAEAAGRSKQTAYSKWGNRIETQADGRHYLVDYEKDRELPLARIDSSTPRHDFGKPPNHTDEQLKFVRSLLPSVPETAAHGLIDAAYVWCRSFGDDWSEPGIAEHFIKLACNAN